MLELFDPLQHVLNFGNCTSPQFVGNGLGKMGTTGFMIGLVGGIHLGVGVTLYIVKAAINTDQNESILSALVSYWYVLAGDIPVLKLFTVSSQIMWCTYMSLLCCFHFMEFFTTAVHQPKVLSYDCKFVDLLK